MESREPELRSLGGPLSPSDAGYLQDELAKRGIRVWLHEDGPGAVEVQVREGDHEAAERLRAELMDERPAQSPGRHAGPGRRRALLVGVLGSIVVLYLGRSVPRQVRAALAIVVGLVLFLVVGPLLDAAPDAGPGVDHESKE